MGPNVILTVKVKHYLKRKKKSFAAYSGICISINLKYPGSQKCDFLMSLDSAYKDSA